MRAARYGHLDIVQLLIDHKANLEVQEVETGISALIHAVKWNRPKVVKLLVDSKANVNLQDKVLYVSMHTQLYVLCLYVGSCLVLCGVTHISILCVRSMAYMILLILLI
jgi:predicted RNA-binding protein YlqC (UPF0109 family)